MRFCRPRSARILALIALAVTLGCGSDSTTGPDNKPLEVSVSEIPVQGGSQARFSWNGLIYRMAVVRPNANGTSVVLWSWEVIDPSFQVRDGITYGATPPGAGSCGIHQCTATGLSRGTPYRVTVYRGSGESASRDFTL